MDRCVFCKLELEDEEELDTHLEASKHEYNKYTVSFFLSTGRKVGLCYALPNLSK